ncbi:ATP-binding protein [Pantanalinema rosaneae CENA516]|uniref:ATP-binding protein n=1 Tax=Pantanalinema rosaneae TaxID=1620701 RepID=UPI003D6E2146
MNQPILDHQLQTQDNLVKGTHVSGNLTFAPVQIGTKIETQIIQTISTEVTQRSLIKTSPYLGLKRFNFKDRDRFFGRDQLIARLFEAVNHSPLSLVLGASGSGKSSVVRAGLIPELKKSLDTQTFYDLIFTPNHDPFAALHRCLLNEEKEYNFSRLDAEMALEGQEDTLPKIISTLKRQGERWLIFVDQFEELFTLCEDADKRKNFISGLVQVAQSGDSSVKIVLAMRSDFLEQFSFYPNLGAIANQNNLHLVTEMYPDELRQAIEQPAARHGVVFEEGLIEQIIKEVEGQKGYLPLLQYTLNLLWESECQSLDDHGLPNIVGRTLTRKSYTALEGVRGALQKRVNEIYSQLKQEEQTTTKQIFLKLVNIVDTDSGSKAVSRRAYRDEFFGESVEIILSRFIEEKLLVSSSENPNPDALRGSHPNSLKQAATVEIAHEILLSSWQGLKCWLEEEKEVIILKNWLSSETKRWQKIHSHNPSQAQDELLKGSRLEQIVEFRRRNAFKNIGELSPEEEQFVEASVEWQRQQEQQKKHRRRHTIVSLMSFSALSLGLASFAAVQLWNVQIAEQQRQEGLIHSAWISLKPTQKSSEAAECGTWLDFGLRDLYCRIKPFVDYGKLRVISGLPAFRQGPHTDFKLNFEGGYEFGYYNPEFLTWIQQEAIIDPGDNVLKQQIQLAYNDKIKPVARAFYKSHQILFASPPEFEAFRERYNLARSQYQELLRTGRTNALRFGREPLEFATIKQEYWAHITQKTLPAEAVGLHLQEQFRWLADYLATENDQAVDRITDDDYWYIVNVSGGFWVRRSLDGTEAQFFAMLTKLLSIYDSEWLLAQASLHK